MGFVKAVPVPVSDRPWVTEGEAMGMVVVDSYLTFRTNFLMKGLSAWRQVGRNKYYLKKDIEDFLSEHGKALDEENGRAIERLQKQYIVEAQLYASRPRKKKKAPVECM